VKVSGSTPQSQISVVSGFWNLTYLATVRNKKVIDSERVQGHYLPVISMVLGKGGRDDLGARAFWRVLGLHWEAAIA
jgi:hypothetical protein